MPYLHPHASAILYALKEKGIAMAVASRSPTPDIAKSFLQTFGVHSLFVTQEIFSSWTHKTEQSIFKEFMQPLGYPLPECSSLMMRIGKFKRHQNWVTSILVGNGVNLGALRQGLSDFSLKSTSSSRS